MAKTALIVRHTPYEGIAGFRLPIEQAGYAVSRIDVTDPAFADLDWTTPDLVALMGGPMGVHEDAIYPWIAAELAGLRRRLDAARPTIGVCLGSQMIAAALGARVFPGPTKEVGFAPVALLPEGTGSPLRHVAGIPVLHWHGDTFDLPTGVERLAETELYAHQAFRIDPWLLALQFHPEMGEDPRIEAWLDGSDAYLAEAGTDAARVRADYAAHGPRAVVAGRALVAEWLAALPG
ncbi:glutamine amidotransferase [Sphingomonas nostoxanthinifaciens]|uniref:glutamine amidotransferase n=1 Tax=Sphingomonas nostoxanthinifaciens TaxID=2872652 RepID=UPI001CC1F7D5|nr:glutamine amidotransferase [Sphingomonas nostoxanthinifaciens]UAK26198.1 glutamine amidotransferase [Sphingomonas nostoxanthinifaciens]